MSEIPDRTDELAALHREVFESPSAPSQRTNGQHAAVDLEVSETIARASSAKNGDKFRRLFNGDTLGYESQSEADLALASEIAFWTGPDPAKIEAVFNQSALAQREKWQERPDYRARTIAAALEGRTEFYTPTAEPSRNRHNLAADAPITLVLPEKPVLAQGASHGPLGEIVAVLSPHTEASDAAILLSLIVAFGNATGRGPHGKAEADRHGTNFNVVLVGETSKARKGSSWGQVRELVARVDPIWASERVQGGLSSGEGLIWAVRDPISVKERVSQKGEEPRYEDVEKDHGVDDKRLLVVETEFSGVLKVAVREGNTLSNLIRQAWDTGDLRSMTKNNPATATGAHISILGHVTKAELLRYLTETEAANGFGNRFLWAWTERSKLLPDGGGEPPYQQIVVLAHDALERARKTGYLARDEQARVAWAAVYPELSEGKPGLLGAMTARAEAQVLRLSVLYAALDGDTAIRLEHLLAALAVWEYCEASARYIFGEALGDPVADTIYAALANSELDRTAISSLFGRNVSAGRLQASLNQLLANGKVRVRLVPPEDGKGRPREVWSRT